MIEKKYEKKFTILMFLILGICLVGQLARTATLSDEYVVSELNRLTAQYPELAGSVTNQQLTFNGRKKIQVGAAENDERGNIGLKTSITNKIGYYRVGVFKANLERIFEHNQNPNKTYLKGTNKFALNTFEENDKLLNPHLSILSSLPLSIIRFFTNKLSRKTITAPIVNVDWRAKDILSPVKDQGSCGGCWAFVLTGAAQAYVAQTYQKNNRSKPYPILSEQFLIDCVTNNYGCDGGILSTGYKYLFDQGIPTDKDYPFVGKVGKCNKTAPISFKINGYRTGNGCQGLATAVSIRPVSVGLDASNWFNYQQGIFNECAQTLNHAVLIVGVNQNAWIIKNEWGPKWGEQGYIRIKYGETCGICKQPGYYPI